MAQGCIYSIKILHIGCWSLHLNWTATLSFINEQILNLRGSSVSETCNLPLAKLYLRAALESHSFQFSARSMQSCQEIELSCLVDLPFSIQAAPCWSTAYSVYMFSPALAMFLIKQHWSQQSCLVRPQTLNLEYMDFFSTSTIRGIKNCCSVSELMLIAVSELSQDFSKKSLI